MFFAALLAKYPFSFQVIKSPLSSSPLLDGTNVRGLVVARASAKVLFF